MPTPPPINIDPSIPPTEITGTCTGSVWSGNYTISAPDSSQLTSFQQPAFLPPCGNTSSPGLSNTSITATSGGASLETDYTGAWKYPAYFIPADVEMALIIKKPAGGWPMGGIVITITLTYD
jgi:hypothetical protein